ncbi:MAG: hypothetical protein IM552_02390, partial [Chitinophagaceae bacterium]|nr:hypothetical protein [Chitinophagaceae bacterium]
MRYWLPVILFFFSGFAAQAAHLKGGWIQYNYQGPGASPGTSRYQIIVRQYMDCNSTQGQKDNSVFLGIFNSRTGALIRTETITRPANQEEILDKTTFNPCLSFPPRVCFLILRYELVTDLPDN